MKKYINKVIIIFIIIQFAIDIVTSIMVTKELGNVTIGIILKTIFLICLALYAFISSNKEMKKKQILYYILLGIYGIIFCSLMLYKEGINTLFIQIKSLIKTFYFPLLLIAFISLERSDNLKIKESTLVFALFGYVVIILIAKLTGTAFWSYPYRNNIGTVGWFYAANEIGNIMAMLFPILIIYIMKKDFNVFTLLCLCISIFAMLEIGTKVPFLSLILIAALVAVICLIERKKRFYKILIGEILICIIVVLLLGSTPIGKNIRNNYGINLLDITAEIQKEQEEQEKQEEPEEPENQEINAEIVLSNRTQFLKTNFEQYKNSSIMNKIFGLGYVKENEQIKTTEMDFYDILFFNGIAGVVIYWLPIIILMADYVATIKKYSIKQMINKEIIILLFDCCLIMGIAFFTGHVLTAPAVTTYLAIIISQLDNEIYKKIYEGDSK